MMSSASSPRSGEDSRTWDVSHLPPRLLRLIRRPKRLGAHKLWRTLEEAERSAALKSFIELGGENRGKLVRVVAEGRNFRAATVDRWDDTKIVRTLQTLPLPNRLANSLLHVLHLERRREMLAHFLDALDIPNDDGVAKGFSDPDPGEAVVRGAAEDLAREHGIRRVVVYFLTLASPRVTPTVPFADHLWHWMKGLLERAQGRDAGNREPGPRQSCAQRRDAQRRADRRHSGPARSSPLKPARSAPMATTGIMCGTPISLAGRLKARTANTGCCITPVDNPGSARR